MDMTANYNGKDGQDKPSGEMIRKLRRMYKQCFLIFFLVLCLRTAWHVRHQPVPYTAAIQQNVYPTELLRDLNETVQDYPLLVTTVERVGPGIDKRTEELRNLTFLAFAELASHTCNDHERFFDRFISDTSTNRIERAKYMQELSIIRTVVETSQRERFRSSSIGNTITLITQLTSDRTYMLDIIVGRWEGPVIAVVYVGADMIGPKHKQLSHWLTTKVGRDNVMLLLAIKAGSLYPVNWLRNLGMSRAYSKYIFVTDGDFVPSVQLYPRLISHLNRLKGQGRTKTVILVPAYEMLLKDMHIPATRSDLLRDYKLGLVDGFHRGSFEAAHNTTNYRKWSKATEPYMLPKEKPCNDHFEPYLVTERTKSPFFPETLLERRKNKIAFQYELCTHGYEYMVIHDGFVIHKHHPESMRALAKVELCVEVAWKIFKDYVATHSMSTVPLM